MYMILYITYYKCTETYKITNITYNGKKNRTKTILNTFIG